MNKSIKDISLKIIKIFIVILILFFLTKALFNSWDQISKYSFKINYPLMSISVIIVCLAYFSAAFGWICTIKKLKQKLSLKNGLLIFFKAQISKYIPGTIWSYIGRIYMAKKQKIPKTITFISLILEAVFLVSTSAMMSFLVLLPYLGQRVFSHYLVYFIIATIPILSLHPRVLNFLIYIISKVLKKRKTDIRIRYYDLLEIFGIYVLRGIFLGVGFIAFSNAIYPISFVNWPLLFGISILSWLAGYLFVIAPGGMGVKEAVIAFLLKPVMPTGIAIIIALGSRIWLILGETTAFGLATLYKKYPKKKNYIKKQYFRC